MRRVLKIRKPEPSAFHNRLEPATGHIFSGELLLAQFLVKAYEGLSDENSQRLELVKKQWLIGPQGLFCEGLSPKAHFSKFLY